MPFQRFILFLGSELYQRFDEEMVNNDSGPASHVFNSRRALLVHIRDIHAPGKIATETPALAPRTGRDYITNVILYPFEHGCLALARRCRTSDGYRRRPNPRSGHVQRKKEGLRLVGRKRRWQLRAVVRCR